VSISTRRTFTTVFLRRLFAIEFEIHGACLVDNERKQVWTGERFRHVRRLKLVTTSGNVVEFERRATGGISRMLFCWNLLLKKERK